MQLIDLKRVYRKVLLYNDLHLFSAPSRVARPTIGHSKLPSPQRGSLKTHHNLPLIFRDIVDAN